MYKNDYSKNFIFTVALLPTMVQSVIMIVHGNLGAGITVAGAFSLVRFRSAPGNAREMATIFFAMTVGLATGRGYLLYATFFTIVVSLSMLLYTFINFGSAKQNMRLLRITFPESLDYQSAFSSVFEKYTQSTQLDAVKTVNLGTLFEARYRIELKKEVNEKYFLDELRQLNDNLEIILTNDNFDRHVSL
ncbi:hypothetical protein FD20_GL001746 [Liquorilactobacillus uvarum DSM 19971]|uniref:DUF4956 domain-containing protein n=2 Tax=Liquorilactobacillus uvarum TaxID=303240 RepID=A0A0R1QBN0_9LACO|nr:hypothetical protein FD20_GL001746 [Liquorilactobacillus uvarum DSM 19971]